MVLCGITLNPLAEDIQEADLELLAPFYAKIQDFMGQSRVVCIY